MSPAYIPWNRPESRLSVIAGPNLLLMNEPTDSSLTLLGRQATVGSASIADTTPLKAGSVRTVRPRSKSLDRRPVLGFGPGMRTR